MGEEVEKLVAQLKESAENHRALRGHPSPMEMLLRDAAATLERMERERQEDHQALLDADEAHQQLSERAQAAEAQVEALRKALERICDVPGCSGRTVAAIFAIARAALSAPAEESVKQECCMAPECRSEGYCLYQQRACAGAEESGDHPAEQDAHELTKALTGIVGGGSEMFVRKRGRFLADIPYCVERIRDRLQRAERRALDETLRAKRYEKLLRKASDLFLGINDRLENDGDRVFLGSTNDADTIHNLGHELQDIPAAPAEARSEQPAGEEFLEFKEALDDVRALRAEYECLNGGGPGWAERNRAAWARVDELFANEDEAAYDRQQESFYG